MSRAELFALAVLTAALPAADLTRSSYRGWSTYRLTNRYIAVDIAPALGGRVVGYSLGSHQFIWTNPLLAGREPPPSGLGPNGEWLNWGGDKLWPAPQGWDGPHQWPGPPDAVLDGSPHQAAIEGPAAIRLTSGTGSCSGVRFSRVVRIGDGSSVVSIRATMTNVDSKMLRWGIWTVTQLDAGDHSGRGPNPDFRAYIPLGDSRREEKAFAVLFGEESNPQFAADPFHRLLRVHYQRRVGKVGVNSSAGWVASVDGATGNVFVQTFRYAPGAEYPDGSSCEYWTNGLGKIFAWGRETVMPESVAENPFVVESELLRACQKITRTSLVHPVLY